MEACLQNCLCSLVEKFGVQSWRKILLSAESAEEDLIKGKSCRRARIPPASGGVSELS